VRLTVALFLFAGLIGCAILPVPSCEIPNALTFRPNVGFAEVAGVRVAAADHSLSVWPASSDVEFNTDVPPIVKYAVGSACFVPMARNVADGFTIRTSDRRVVSVQATMCNERRGFCFEAHVDLKQP
jgi:hypothetical protein